VVKNKHTGYETTINKPGFSAMDILQGIGLTGLYAGPGKLATAPLRQVAKEHERRWAAWAKGELQESGLKAGKQAARRETIKRAAVLEGGVEYGAQKIQESVGGRFDPADVALAAVVAPVPEVLFGPLANLALKSKDVLLRGGQWPDNIKKAVQFAEAQGYQLTTSDAMENLVKPRRRIFLKAAERLPWVGTATIRADQLASRADTVRGIANRMGVRANTDYGAYILNSFVNQKRHLLAEANGLKQKAIDSLEGAPDLLPANFWKALDIEYAAAATRGPNQRKAVEEVLDSYSANVDAREVFPFADGATLLDDMYVDEGLGTLFPGLKGEVQGRLGEALLKDLDEHAQRFGGQTAFNAWNKSRNVWQQPLRKIKDTAIAKAISSGDLSVDLIDDVYRRGSIKEIRALHASLSQDGKDLVKQRSLAHLISQSGGTYGDLRKVNLKTFRLLLDNDEAFNKVVKTFWSDEDRAFLDGAKEYLRYTENATKTMEGAGMISAGGAQSQIAGLMAAFFPPTMIYGRLARFHESGLVRNLFLDLKHAEGQTDTQRVIMSELRPMMLALGNVYFEEGRDPFSSTVEPTMLEKALMGSGQAGAQLFGAVTGFRLPFVREETEGEKESAQERLREQQVEVLMEREEARRAEGFPKDIDLLEFKSPPGRAFEPFDMDVLRERVKSGTARAKQMKAKRKKRKKS